MELEFEYFPSALDRLQLAAFKQSLKIMFPYPRHPFDSHPSLNFINQPVEQPATGTCELTEYSKIEECLFGMSSSQIDSASNKTNLEQTASPNIVDNWPNNFMFPSNDLSELTKLVLKDIDCKLRPVEIKELVTVLFNKMLPFTNSYPKSRHYILGVASIFVKYPHLNLINGKEGNVVKFELKLIYFIINLIIIF